MNTKYAAKYAFYYILSLVALVFVGISVGMIAFSIIDLKVFDPLSYNSYGGNQDGSLKFAISALFIAAPIYYFTLSLIARGLKKNEIERSSAIRRWLTYFIILVSSLIILGVFIGVINNFLSGELSARFILKAASMFLISALVFSYYFYDVKREELGVKKNIQIIFLSISLLFVLGAFISAWFFVESPREARMRRLDQIVVNNINSLENAVNSFYAEEGRLPDDLSNLKIGLHLYDRNALVDPESGKAIEYKKINDKEFEFCAEFRLPSQPTDLKGRTLPSAAYGPVSGDDHQAGYDCLKGDLWAESKMDALKAKEVISQ